MLIRGGENIYCVEVENVLYEHPAIMDAAIVAVPHRTLGEEAGAVVYLKPGMSATEDEIRQFVGAKLAAFKVPVKVVFWQETLPRNANGKILKVELKKVFAEAEMRFQSGKATLLFVDEIHRFNRSQQDSFLPYVERGTVVLVGATTENPSFELNAALLSRAQVLILNRLDKAALGQILEKAETIEDKSLPLTVNAREALIASADGDGRFLLNQAETLFSLDIKDPLDPHQLAKILHRRMAVYDKDREGHYNLISALHKALRGSDPQASLYYLARMLVAGEQPLFLLRRIVRFAVEDIGMADPQALVQALAAKQAYEFLGSPEGELAIVQACLYCATAPKSNAAYNAQKSAWKSARDTGSLMPPQNILNAPTKLMKEIGYGSGYSYDHESDDGFSGDNYWPEEMQPQNFYQPVDRGFEHKIRERLDYWEKLRAEKAG